VFKVSSRCFLFKAYSKPAKAKASKGNDYVSIQSRSPPRKFHASKLIRQILALSLGTLLIVQVPAQVSRPLQTPTLTPPAQAVGQKRTTLPFSDLPDVKQVLTEDKIKAKVKPSQPPLKPSTLCGHRDKACKDKLKGKTAENMTAPSGTGQSSTLSGQLAADHSPSASSGAETAFTLTSPPEQRKSGNWLSRLGRRLTGAVSSLASSFSPRASAYKNSWISLNGAGNEAAVRVFSAMPALAPVAAPPPPPPSFTSLPEALLDARNRTGSGGEDLFSGNYNFSVPLVSLPGRNGLDLNLSLSYNSLVWVRYNNTVSFEPDYYPSLTPGFRLGFPEISGPYWVSGWHTYIVTLPGGRRVAMRQTAVNNYVTYEATDSSGLQLTVNSSPSSMILRTTDGTQLFYNIFSGGDYRCTRVQDSNGNFLTIAWALFGNVSNVQQRISTITDTLGRVIIFNYDSNDHLLSITQNWQGQTYYWAQFDYSNIPIQTNFPGLTVDGPTNGTSIPVISRVILGNGAAWRFGYNAWGQADQVQLLGEQDNLRAASVYAFTSNTVAHSECPRFTQRNDYLVNWMGENWTGWVSHYFYLAPDETFGQVTTPDGITSKEFFHTTGGLRGLGHRMETWHGGQVQKFSTVTWASDSTSGLPLRPRITETKVVDDLNHDNQQNAGDKVRRSVTTYTALAGVYLPDVVKEYNADATSVYRSTKTTYITDANYLNRRIIGLPSFQKLYQGDAAVAGQHTLVASTGFIYDSPNGSTTYLSAHSTAPVQHDSTNYGSGFLSRGNLTRALRYSVVNGTQGTYTETQTGYHTTGTVAWAKDAEGKQTSLFYNDAFTIGNIPAGAKYAYPSRVQDADGYSSAVKYHYDLGAVTETIDQKNYALSPKDSAQLPTNPPVKTLNSYDWRGRLERAAVWKDGAEYAWTRTYYGADHNWYQTLSTVNTTAEETSVWHFLDGAGRERITFSEHPGSTGGYRLSYVVFDKNQRVIEQSNPTEVNGNWQIAGDDSAYIISTQQYDWKGRPTISTHQDGTTRSVSYTGCGCAGQDEVTSTDEMGRKQKAYYDVFGRVTRTEILNASNTVYSSRVPVYNVRDQVETMTEYAGAPGSGGASQATLMTYDGFGRLASRKRPQENAPTTYAYYQNDKLYSGTDARGAVGTLSYNNRNLLTQASYSVPSGVAATPDVTFQYNENGQRTLMDDGPGQVSYEYNTLGQLFRETRSYDAITSRNFPLEYEYSLSGQMKKVTDPYNDSISYALDKTGRVTGITGSPYGGVTNYATGIAYRAWDAPKAVSFGSGFSASAKYTARLQVREFDIPTVIGGTYQYNPDGSLNTFVAETPQSNEYDRYMDRAFSYDEHGRMSSTTSSGGLPYLFTYEYDEFGNLKKSDYRYWQISNFPQSFEATYQNGRVTTASDGGVMQTWNYDAMGNRTSLQNTVNGTTTTVESLVVDAVGRPGERDGDGNPYLSNGAYLVRSSVLGGEILTTVEGSAGGKLATRVLDGGRLIAEQQDGSVTWYHRDPLNLVARNTKPGQVKERVFAVTPTGGQIETTAGVNLSQYYACMFGGQNNPGCSGYNPQPPSGYGYLHNQAANAFASGLKVDGALTLWSPQDVAGQAGRNGTSQQLSVWISPALSGTPLVNGESGSFVQRTRYIVQNNYLWDDEEGGSKTLAGSSIVGFINETTYVPGGSGIGSELQAIGQQHKGTIWEPWVVKDFWDLHAQVTKLPLPDRFINDKGSAECALLPQLWQHERTGATYHTATWRRGPSLMDGNMDYAPGTVFATGWIGGKYDTKNKGIHTVILGRRETDASGNVIGVWIIDQYRSGKANKLPSFRQITPGGGQPYYNDANAFYAVMVSRESSDSNSYCRVPLKRGSSR
jgi:YD repeat-containing protein